MLARIKYDCYWYGVPLEYGEVVKVLKIRTDTMRVENSIQQMWIVMKRDIELIENKGSDCNAI